MPASDLAAAAPFPNNSKGKGKAKTGYKEDDSADIPLATTSSAAGVPIFHPLALPSTHPNQNAPDRPNDNENSLSIFGYSSYDDEIPLDFLNSPPFAIDPVLSTNAHHLTSASFHPESQEMETDAQALGGVSPSAIPDAIPWSYDSHSLLFPVHFLEDLGMNTEEDVTWSLDEEVYEETILGVVGTEEQDTEPSAFTEDTMYSAHGIRYQFKAAEPVSPGEVYRSFHTEHWVCVLLLCILYLHTHCKLGHAPIRKLLVTLRWVLLFALRILPLDDPFPITLATLLKKVEPLTHYFRMPLCPICHTFAPLNHQSLTPDSKCLACGTALAHGADGKPEAHATSSSSRRSQLVKPKLEAPHRPLAYYLNDMLQELGIEQELEDFMHKTSNSNVLSSVRDGRICQKLKAHDGTPFFGKPDHTDLSIGVVMHYDGYVVLILIDLLLTRLQVPATSRPVFWIPSLWKYSGLVSHCSC